MPALRKNSCLSLGFLFVIPAVVVVAVFTALPKVSGADRAPADEQNRELDRARREVKLLDDLYKTAIVLITTHYVDDDADLPAGKAFKALFAGMKEKGWHEVRLLDATGEPLNEENAPQDAFEKDAVQALLAGKSSYEQQMQKDGKRFLRIANPIPIVLEKCTMCHHNYRDQKVIGALGYILPLDVKDAGRQ